MVDAMLAWGTDYHFVYIDIAGTGLLVGEAERQGKLVVSTELGGGGHVTAATHRIAQSGLANVLRHVGVLRGRGRTRDTPPMIVDATDGRQLPARAGDRGSGRRSSTSATASTAGQPVGQIHFLERPDREPGGRRRRSPAASSSSSARSRRPRRATTSSSSAREVDAEELV